MRRDALEDRTGRPNLGRSFVRFGALAAATNAIAVPKRIIRE
jgi:hypothetical protein